MSFALPDQRPVGPGGSGRQPAPVQAGVVGGVTVNPNLTVDPIQVPRSVSTFNSLLKVGGEVVAPIIQKQREARFVQGMSRAAQGEAAKDIAAEQPEWARIFGDGDVVAGARAYEGAADGARLETALAQGMEEDRKLPPEEYAASAMQRLEALKTGDPVRDTSLQAQALKALPFAMKAHAKAYAQYKNEEGFRARGEAIGAAVDAFEAVARPDTTPEDRAAHVQTLLAGLTAPEGENAEWRDKQVVAQLARLMTQGKFQTVLTLKEVGAWDALPAQQQDTLNRTFDVESRKRKWAGMTPELYGEFHALTTNPPEDNTALIAQVDMLNAKKRVLSGIPTDLIEGDDVARLFGVRERNAEREAAAQERAADRQERQQDRAQRAAERAADRQERQQDRAQRAAERAADAAEREVAAGQLSARVSGLLQDGMAGALSIELAGPDGPALRQELRRQLGPTWAQSGLEGQVKQVLAMPAGTHPILEGEIESLGVQASYTDGFLRHAALVRSLPPKLAQSYWGKAPDSYDLLKRFNNLQDSAIRSGETVNPAGLYDRARAEQATVGFKGTASKEDREALTRVQRSYLDENWSTQDTVRGEYRGQELLQQIAAHRMGTMRQSMDPEEAAALAYEGVRGAGFRNTGRLGYLDLAAANGQPQSDWASRLGMGRRPEEAVSFLERAMERKLGRSLTRDDLSTIVRLPDEAGKFKFMTRAVTQEQGQLPKITWVPIFQADIEFEQKRSGPQAREDGAAARAAAMTRAATLPR